MTDSSLMRLYRHRELAWEMAKREAQSVYKGSIFGIAWLAVKPLIQAAVPIVLVSTTWHAAGGKPLAQLDLAAYVLAGMIPWQILSRVLEESTQLVRDRTNLVKQVRFPLETLPMMSLLTSFIGASVTFLVWIILAAVLGKVSWTCFLLPIPLLILEVLVVGLAWGLMMVGVVVKDIRNVVGLGMLMCGFLSPVTLVESRTSTRVWNAILLNPLSHVVIAFRDVLYGTCHPLSWLVFVGSAIVSWLIGASILRRTRLWINDLI